MKDWNMVSGGHLHIVALKNDGTLWAWGYNEYGQLGMNHTSNLSSPVQVGSLNNWKAIFGGGLHSLALKTDGSIWCWGNNEKGQLGSNDTIHRSSPIQIGSNYDWKTIKSGKSSTSILIK
jgi:alpha-tubulin suppressor-like RCC1 family protein